MGDGRQAKSVKLGAHPVVEALGHAGGVHILQCQPPARVLQPRQPRARQLRADVTLQLPVAPPLSEHRPVCQGEMESWPHAGSECSNVLYAMLRCAGVV